MRIGNDARRCVVFFGVPTEHGVQYGGTGFLVCRRYEGSNFTYIVTARHVAVALGKFEDTGFFVRANSKNGSAEEVAIQNISWRFHPDSSVDIAVAFVVLNEVIDQTFYELSDEHQNWIKTPDEVAHGDVINIVGFFRLHTGSQRNVPIVHTGNIAALADEKEKVPLRDRISNSVIQTESYLIEAQTLDGLSGSPVFIHEVVALNSLPRALGALPRMFRAIKLLGVYTGAWDGEPGTILAADRNLRGGVRVPVGMGTVAPIAKLIDILDNDEVLKKARDQYVRSLSSSTSTSPLQ